MNTPIKAAEHFIAASVRGHPLATANVIRQYLRAGFVEDARKWAETHQPASDPEGHIMKALADIHNGRDAEIVNIQERLSTQLDHRTMLARFAKRDDQNAPLDGDYSFPFGNLTISHHGDTLAGTGTTTTDSDSMDHVFRAALQNGTWRFEVESKKRNDAFYLNRKRRFGIVKFSDEGLAVLEYSSGGKVATYTASRI